jgi:hypothetical protein
MPQNVQLHWQVLQFLQWQNFWHLASFHACEMGQNNTGKLLSEFSKRRKFFKILFELFPLEHKSGFKLRRTSQLKWILKRKIDEKSLSIIWRQTEINFGFEQYWLLLCYFFIHPSLQTLFGSAPPGGKKRKKIIFSSLNRREEEAVS